MLFRSEPPADLSAALGNSLLHSKGELTSPHGGQTWMVAAVDAPTNEPLQYHPTQASYRATAVCVFDLVFLSVALVSYSTDPCTVNSPARTSGRRDAGSQGHFVKPAGEKRPSAPCRVSSVCLRFDRAAAETRSTVDPLSSSTFTATPFQRPSVSSSPCPPTGPPGRPLVTIRGWTGRLA